MLANREGLEMRIDVVSNCARGIVVLWSSKDGCNFSKKESSLHIGCAFWNPRRQERLVQRLKHIQQLLSQAGSLCTNNHSLMGALFDTVEYSNRVS